jgi:hypothetical protein
VRLASPTDVGPGPARLQLARPEMYQPKMLLDLGPTVEYPFRGFIPSYRKQGDPFALGRKRGDLLWALQVRPHH